MDSSRSRATGPISPSLRLSSIEPDAAWKSQAEQNIRARFLPQIQDFRWAMIRKFRINSSLGMQLEKEHSQYMAGIESQVEEEVKNAIDRERAERRLAAGLEADPIRATAGMKEQRDLIAGHSKDDEEQSSGDSQDDDTDVSVETYGIQDEDDDDAVTPEYRATWESSQDTRFQRRAPRYSQSKQRQEVSQHVEITPRRSRSRSLLSAKSTTAPDIEWAQLTDQIEQAFDTLYTAAKSSIHVRLSDSKNTSLNQLESIVKDHLDRMNKIRQFALEQYDGVCDLMMGELRWVNRLREDKMEEHFMKEYEVIHTRTASCEEIAEQLPGTVSGVKSNGGEKVGTDGANVRRKPYRVHPQPQQNPGKATQRVFRPRTRSVSTPSIVIPDNTDSGFIDPDRDQLWKSQIQSKIASDLASEYEDARNELDSVLESGGMFDPTSADLVANDCLERLEEIKQRAKQRFGDAIEDERLRRLCFAAKIVEPRLVERFVSQSREVLYRLKEPFREDDDSSPVASTSNRGF